jgi:SAM-dependent methyltransferase
MPDPELVAYYRERAEEYDAVYTKPERQSDIQLLRLRLQQLVSGRRVLELAAGTGFWTEAMAVTAERVLATDVNAETLAVAQRRDYPLGNVTFANGDAFAPGAIDGDFDTVVAGFFVSHIERASVQAFIAGAVERVATGRIILFDNNYVEGSNHPVTHRAATGDTYQRRELSSGSEFDVLKNFYGETELRQLVEPYGDNLVIANLQYYWLVAFDSRGC